MSLVTFIAVFGAALLHATWNTLLKSGDDKVLSMAGIVVGHIPFGIVALFFVSLPSINCLPYLGASIVFHTGYQFFLLKSYQIGDLTHVYPLARGSAPILVTIFSVVVLGVKLHPLHLLSILLITCGIISLTLARHDNGQFNFRATKFALITGLFIASYSLVDGLGARVAETSWGFYSCLTIGNGIIAICYLVLTKPNTLIDLAFKGRKIFVIGGGTSFLAYGIVTWAFTQAPIALVTALRETSIIFALLMGVFFLKERLSFIKVCSTFSTLFGVILLRFIKSQW